MSTVDEALLDGMMFWSIVLKYTKVLNTKKDKTKKNRVQGE